LAYDEGLAHRVRELLEARPGASEKKMFGGLCFLLNGHMACGIVKSELMVRVGPAAYEAALEEPAAREMDFTGRPLKGMIYVGEDGIAEDADLEAWVDRGVAHAESLPPKDSAAGGKKSSKKASAKTSSSRAKAPTRSRAKAPTR
jgi:TfoX/Sxy family transcriptional regulator of competence genes